MGKLLDRLARLVFFASLLVFLRFKLLPNILYSKSCRPQTWQFYLVFPALSISAIHKVLGIKFKGGRSRDPELQKAYSFQVMTSPK